MVPPIESQCTDLILGIEGFSYPDLYDPHRLEALTTAFLETLKKSDAGLFQRYETYKRQPENTLSPPEESELLIQIAFHQSAFIAKIFNISAERDAFMSDTQSKKLLFRFKKEFVQKRVLKSPPTEPLNQNHYDALNEKVRVLINVLLSPVPAIHDSELLFAKITCFLLDAETALALNIKRNVPVPDEIIQNITGLHEKIKNHPEAKETFSTLLKKPFDSKKTTDLLGLAQSFLDLLGKWVYASQDLPHEECVTQSWSAFKTPLKIDFKTLVETTRPDENLPEKIAGLDKTLRKRDGFKLTDRRYSEKQVLAEIDYCVICHPREKDSCRIGFHDRETGALKKNPLGIELTGCPLDERISEMHYLHGEGDPIAALAVIVIDNPMLPATGHRICNDCMKGCIYQKQEPVNIPQVETRILTDVLDFPYGFEIYSLLTRWNPMHIKRPHALPYNGKRILIVGMGPAGFTLAQFLLNEGFGIVGIDGLKIEPLPKSQLWDNTKPPLPIKNVQMLNQELDTRVLTGFGGVAEYGITVRWDKNFLDLIYLTLARRNHFKVYGGVRFGGTVTVDQAWALGFDHIAIAAGAGKPTLPRIKNNLIRGIRKASDFLMALQLTGAFKKSSLANLQIRMPVIIIGGGLTAIDTATEAMAYYPVQVEKVLDQYEKLNEKFGKAAILEMFDAEEREILDEFLDHGQQIRAERARANADGVSPNFVPMLRKWGGVSLVYRRDMLNSPAYQLNHEEVIKSLEEGIYYIELLSPTEAIPDQYGAVSAMTFEKQQLTPEGRLTGTEKFLTLSAKTVLVAAGTSPNVIYEKEHPGTFKMDDHNKFFKRFEPEWKNLDTPKLVPSPDWSTPALFTSYQKDGKFITFYGDNHPVYAGNVVKAMASAKKGYPYIKRLFEKDLAILAPEDQSARNATFETFAKELDEKLQPTVVSVIRLTPTIVEIIVKAPLQASAFQPGQFYRLQNYETCSETVDGICLNTEGIALTGAWVDRKQGLLSLIALELGVSSRLCASLKPGDPVVAMGPTGAPTEILSGETVLLAGGGLGNAVLFSIGKAMREKGNTVIYFAGYKNPEDVYKIDEIEAASDVVIWSVDAGEAVTPRRPQDKAFIGNIVQAMMAYAEGALGETSISLMHVNRIIAIGSDRMMEAVKTARHTLLAPYLNPDHIGIGSINSPMQCMMKEVCAQCLQKHINPETGEETDPVFSCFNQDQPLDCVDFSNLRARLKQNSVQEKLSNKMLDLLMEKHNIMRV